MANELGSIQYEDSRQRTSVREQNDKRDVLQGIKDVGEKAIDVRTQDILGDLRGDLDDTTREAAEVVEPSASEVAVVNTGDPEADAAVARIATLQLKANASTGNTQKRVEMELRRQTENLRRKFPGLRGQIDAEFSAFKATDKDYASLALSDAGNASFSAQAAKELDLIRAEAYGNGPGQLGMDPLSYPMDSVEFVKKYQFEQTRLQDMQNNVRLAAATHSKRAQQATELPGLWNPIIQGQSSVFEATMQKANKAWQQVASAYASPMAPGSAAQIEQWQVVGAKQALLEVEAVEFGLQMQLSEIPMELRDSPEYRAIESEVTGLTQQTAQFKEAITTGDPTLMAVYEAKQTARTMNWELENPQMVAINTALDASKTALEFALKSELGTEGQRQASAIAGLITETMSLPTIFGYAVPASGQITAPPNSTPETLKEHRQAFAAQNANRNGADQSPEGYRKAALERCTKLLGPTMDLALKDGVAPSTAANHIGCMAMDTEDLTSRGPVEQQAWDGQIENLASPNVLKYNEAALQSAYSTAGVDLGEEADILWDKKEVQRSDGYVLALGEDLGNGAGALANYIAVDLTSLKKDGSISFTIDEQAIRANAGNEPSTSLFAGDVTGARKQRLATQAVSKAQRQAAELSRVVSIHVRAKAHIQALKQGQVKGNYELVWSTGGYDTYFREAS